MAWRDRSVQVDLATLNRTSVDQLQAYATKLGYKTRETDLLAIDGTIMVTLEGYGEDFEAYFRPNLATGYLCWDYGNKLSDYSADRVHALKALKSALAEIRKTAIKLGWKGEEG